MTALKSKVARPRKRKRIYIVEDHPASRERLGQILNNAGDLTVCGIARACDQALRAIAHTKPDLVLVNISLLGKSGLELIKLLRAVDRTVKLLVISMRDDSLYAARVLRSGADGYIMKQEDLDEIVYAIHDLLEGHIYVSEKVMESKRTKGRSRRSDQNTSPLDHLTDSELEILELVGRAMSSREIACKLSLSERSVTAARSQLREKLNLKNSRALFRYAVCWVGSDGR
jgi:DNA-binding NarL/FixJ family response regulator